MAAVQGEGKGNREFIRTLMCDKVTAYTICQAVTTALYVRERTGSGQHIDLSMMDAGLYFLFPDGFMHRTLARRRRHPPAAAQHDALRGHGDADGDITVSAATPAQQVGLLTAIDRLELFADERFNSMEKLIGNIDAFRAELKATMATFTTGDLLARLHENDVPAARLLDYDEVFTHPQYVANDSVDVATIRSSVRCGGSSRPLGLVANGSPRHRTAHSTERIPPRSSANSITARPRSPR